MMKISLIICDKMEALVCPKCKRKLLSIHLILIKSVIVTL